MAGRIVYLEIDDEITSAAARIRDSDASRIAVVLPYGSRVATSRINFRLLSRDALTHEKRLSIVAGDPATVAHRLGEIGEAGASWCVLAFVGGPAGQMRALLASAYELSARPDTR